MGIFSLFSTNFNYILYPFPFFVPKDPTDLFFLCHPDPAGTHHTHYDIYFLR